jgi:hypothetical protein
MILGLAQPLKIYIKKLKNCTTRKIVRVALLPVNCAIKFKLVHRRCLILPSN